MDNPTLIKFSLKEIRAAGLTLDQMREKNLTVDKRRKSMVSDNIEYLKSLGLPTQYSGPTPQIKQRKKPTASPSKKVISPKPSIKKVEKPVQPKKAKSVSKPKVKEVAKPEKVIEPKAEKKVTPKPEEVVKPKPVSKKKDKESPKPSEKTTFEKIQSKSLDPKLEQAISHLFATTPLFDKKSDLIDALEEHVANLSEMDSNQIFDTLKDENIIKYSRSSPRGYSLN